MSSSHQQSVSRSSVSVPGQDAGEVSSPDSFVFCCLDEKILRSWGKQDSQMECPQVPESPCGNVSTRKIYTEPVYEQENNWWFYTTGILELSFTVLFSTSFHLPKNPSLFFSTNFSLNIFIDSVQASLLISLS